MADDAVGFASQRSCHCWLINKKTIIQKINH